MKITLLKKTVWGGKSHNAKSSHLVEDELAQKLISRGYAEEYVEVKESKDGLATDK